LTSRKDNSYLFSGIGGDNSLYFWLIKNRMKIVMVDDFAVDEVIDANTVLGHYKDKEELSSPTFAYENSKYVLKYDKHCANISVLGLRNKLNEFITSNNIVVDQVSDQQLVNLDYLNQFKGTTLEVDSFMCCVNICHLINQKLVNLELLFDQLTKAINDDKNAIIKDFTSRFTFIDSDEDHQSLMQMINSNKEFEPHMCDIDHRLTNITQNIFGYEMKKYFDVLNSMPQHTIIIPMRLIIGIQYLVKFSIDTYLTNVKDTE
jgi:hypothetical protein